MTNQASEDEIRETIERLLRFNCPNGYSRRVHKKQRRLFVKKARTTLDCCNGWFTLSYAR